MTETESESTPLRRIAAYCRENPYAVLVIALFTVVCAVVAAMLPIGELSVARKALGGAIAGFYFSLMPLGFRIFN